MTGLCRPAILLCVFCVSVFFAVAGQAGETINYAYDSLGRLNQVSQAGTVNNNVQSAYCYDPAGNRTTLTTTNTGNVSSPCASTAATLPTVSVGNISGTDGSVVSFPVTLSSASGSTITVNYATANGTAISGTDYVAKSSTLSFSPGVTSQLIAVQTMDRGTSDGDLQFTVTLVSPVGATLGTAIGTATISDPPPIAPSLSIGNASGIDGSVVSFPVTLSAASSSPISVDYATANSTALAGTDFNTTTGTLLFAAGTTTQTIAVQTLDRGTSDGSLQFTMILASPSGATLGTSAGTATITDPAPTGPTVSIGNKTGKDGTLFAFTVTLSAASSSTVTVAYITANGTAIAGPDYTAKSGTLSFAPGTVTQTISIQTLDSGADDSGIKFYVNLSSPSGATLGTAMGTGTMNDPIYICCGTNGPTPTPTATGPGGGG